MNQNSGKGLYLNFSGLGFWLALLVVILLLSSVGLGWLVKSVAVLLLLLLISPIVAYLVFRWWFQRNVIEGSCPVCNTVFIAINKTQTQCPGCGERLVVENKQFVRYSPPGTVDVDAIDVSVKEIDAGDTE